MADDTTTRYALLIYSDTKKWQDISESEMNDVMGEYWAFTEAVTKAGVDAGSEALQDVTTAKTVAPDDVVTDGPFADVTEHLGGFYLIDVPSMDDALAWAARLPGIARGLDRIEVRPCIDFSTG